MDGNTCARRIREAQQEGRLSKRLPIIAVSANARSEQASQAIEAGMEDAITKPFRIGELMPKIERLVGEVLCRKSGIDMDANIRANLRRPAVLEQSAEGTEALNGGKARNETLSKLVG